MNSVRFTLVGPVNSCLLFVSREATQKLWSLQGTNQGEKLMVRDVLILDDGFLVGLRYVVVRVQISEGPRPLRVQLAPFLAVDRKHCLDFSPDRVRQDLMGGWVA